MANGTGCIVLRYHGWQLGTHDCESTVITMFLLYLCSTVHVPHEACSNNLCWYQVCCHKIRMTNTNSTTHPLCNMTWGYCFNLYGLALFG